MSKGSTEVYYCAWQKDLINIGIYSIRVVKYHELTTQVLKIRSSYIASTRWASVCIHIASYLKFGSFNFVQIHLLKIVLKCLTSYFFYHHILKIELVLYLALEKP